MRTKKALTEQQRHDILRVYDTQHSLKRTSQQTGVPVTTVRDTLLAAGVTLAGPEGARPKLSDAQRAEVAAAYAAGDKTTVQIADQYGIHPDTVVKYARQHAVPIRPVGTPHAPYEHMRCDIVAAYVAGATSSQVALRFGVPASTVRRYAKDAGVIRPRGLTSPYSTDMVNAIVEAYVSGRTAQQVAEQFAVSTATVLAKVRGAGQPVRGHGPAKTRPKALDDDARRAIADRYATGESSPALSREFGVTVGTVLGYLAEFGVTVRPPQQKIPASTQARMVRDYQRGLTLQEVATKYGVSANSVSNALRRRGVTARPMTAQVLTAEQQDALGKAYLDGAGTNALARQYGLTVMTVLRYVHEYQARMARDTEACEVLTG